MGEGIGESEMEKLIPINNFHEILELSSLYIRVDYC